MGLFLKRYPVVITPTFLNDRTRDHFRVDDAFDFKSKQSGRAY